MHNDEAAAEKTPSAFAEETKALMRKLDRKALAAACEYFGMKIENYPAVPSYKHPNTWYRVTRLAKVIEKHCIS